MNASERQRYDELCLGSQKRVEINLTVLGKGSEMLELGLTHLMPGEAALARPALLGER